LKLDRSLIGRGFVINWKGSSIVFRGANSQHRHRTPERISFSLRFLPQPFEESHIDLIIPHYKGPKRVSTLFRFS